MLARALLVLRPLDWMHFLLFPVAGAVVGGAPDRAPLAVAVAALLLAQAYGHNEYCDAMGSAEAVTEVPPWSPWWHRVPLILAGGLLLGLPWFGRVLGVLFAAITLLYSGGFRWKQIPFLGTALNGVGFALLCGLAVEGCSAEVLRLMGMAALWVVAVQLVHEEQDATEDRRDGIRTTAQVVGPAWTRGAVLASLGAAAVAGGGLDRRLGLVLAGYAVVVFTASFGVPPFVLRRVMKWFGIIIATGVGALWWMSGSF